jgi:hypothetical protein
VLENSIELSQGITRACAGAGFMQYFGRLWSATWKCPIRWLHWTTHRGRYTWDNSNWDFFSFKLIKWSEAYCNIVYFCF